MSADTRPTSASSSTPSWGAVEQLFGALLELAPDARAARLAQHDDHAVRDEVARLLARNERLDAAATRDPLAALDARRAGALVEEDRMPTGNVGRYRLLGRLGAGAMGTVYLADDPLMGRRVAIKVLPSHLLADADAARRFRAEARLAAAVEHANVATVHEIGDAPDGRLFIVMAHCAGGSLRDRMRDGALPVETVCRVLVELAAGLAAVHACGIVHRDVKPENVLFDADRRVRLADFGIARGTGEQLTRTGVTLGTAAYMSPEQTTGEAADHRADLWSVGVVLYEMLAGQRPFANASGDALVYAIRHDAPTSLRALRRDVPRWLARLVMACLEKDPARRPASARDLGEAARAEAFVAPRALPRGRRLAISALVAAAIMIAATALAPVVGGGSTLRLGWPPIGPSAPDRIAYAEYLQGRALLQLGTPADLARAALHFREAIARDSSLGRAYAGLAQVYTRSRSGTAADRYARARPLVQRAIALDPTLAVAHRELGWIAMWYDRDWPAAERHLRRALALDSTDVWSYHALAAYLGAVGRTDESLATTMRAAAIDPVSAMTSTHVGLHLFYRRRYAESIAVLERTLAVDTTWGRTRAVLGRALLEAGRHDEALVQLAFDKYEYAAFEPGALLAHAHGRVGNRAEARRRIDALEARARASHVAPINLVAAWLGVGDVERALTWLERVPDDRGSMFFILSDPIFDPLRGEPRFDAVVERLGLGEAARRMRAPGR